MSRLPKTVYKEINFRSAASSESQNDFQDTIFEDMMSLYEEAQRISSEVELTKEAVTLGDFFTYGHVRKLENRIQQLELLASKAEKNDHSKTAFAFIENIDVDPDATIDERIHIDPIHQIAHLPIAGQKLSKLHQYESLTSSLEIPDELKIKVLPEKDLGWIMKENDLKNAIDGDENTYWRRKVMVPAEDSRERMIHEVIISIPDSAVFNRKVNMITLNPFPAHSMNVDKIEYRSGGSWKLIPGWKKGDRLTSQMKEVGSIKMCFPEISVMDVKITLSQENWFEENGRKVFHFGLREVGIHHADFRSSVGRFQATIDVSAGDRPKAITGIKPVFANEGALTDTSEEKLSIFNYDIYIIKENGEIQYTKDRFPITVSEGLVLIKGSIGKDKENEGSPALHSIELTYEDV